MRGGLLEPMASELSVRDHQAPCSEPMVQQCKVANLI